MDISNNLAKERTRSLSPDFMPIYEDIKLDNELAVDHDAYISSDSISAFYALKDRKDIIARVYFSPLALTDEECAARTSIGAKYFSTYEYTVDITDGITPLKKKYTYWELKALIKDIREILHGLAINNILHRSLTPDSFGITNAGRLVLRNYASVIKLSDINTVFTDINITSSGVSASPAAVRHIYSLSTDYYSLGIIMGTLYTGTVPTEKEVLNDGYTLNNAPADLQLLIDILLSNHDDKPAVVDDWLTIGPADFNDRYRLNNRAIFTFLGKNYTSRFALAAAMAENWTAAAPLFSTNAVANFLAELHEHDLARETAALMNKKIDCTTLAKALYILADGSNAIFWRRQMNDIKEIFSVFTNDELIGLLTSGILTWIAERQKRPDKEIKQTKDIRSLTEHYHEVGIELAKIVYSAERAIAPISMFGKYDTLTNDTENIEAIITDTAVLAQLAYAAGSDNVIKHLDLCKDARPESKIINFYKLFENAVDKNEKALVCDHFIKSGVFSQEIRDRITAKGYKLPNKNIDDMIKDMGCDDIPNNTDSIDTIDENCHKYRNHVREFQNHRVAMNRATAFYGLYEMEEIKHKYIPAVYGSAAKQEPEKNIRGKLEQKADKFKAITASLTQKRRRTFLRVFIGLILTLTGAILCGIHKGSPLGSARILLIIVYFFMSNVIILDRIPVLKYVLIEQSKKNEKLTRKIINNLPKKMIKLQALNDDVEISEGNNLALRYDKIIEASKNDHLFLHIVPFYKILLMIVSVLMTSVIMISDFKAVKMRTAVLLGVTSSFWKGVLSIFQGIAYIVLILGLIIFFIECYQSDGKDDFLSKAVSDDWMQYLAASLFLFGVIMQTTVISYILMVTYVLIIIVIVYLIYLIISECA